MVCQKEPINQAMIKTSSYRTKNINKLSQYEIKITFQPLDAICFIATFQLS